MKMRIFQIFVVIFTWSSVAIWVWAFMTPLSNSPDYVRTKVQNEFNLVLKDEIKNDKLRHEFIGIASEKLSVGNLIFSWMGIDPPQEKVEDLRASYYLYQVMDDRKGRNS